MRRRTVGAVLAIALGAILLFGIGVTAWAGMRTVRHDPVTTYTDNSLIEPGNTVSYSVWMQDNVTKTNAQIADHDLAVSHSFDDSSLVKGRTYNFTAQAHLLSGDSSDISPVYPWLFPRGKASPVRVPGGWVVTPPN